MVSSEFQKILNQAIHSFFESPDGLTLQSLGFSEEFVKPFILQAIYQAMYSGSPEMISHLMHSSQLYPNSLAMKAHSFCMNRIHRVNQTQLIRGIRSSMYKSLPFVIIVTFLFSIIFAIIPTCVYSFYLHDSMVQKGIAKRGDNSPF